MKSGKGFHLLITARQRSCGKVMFSQVSVCHSVQEGAQETPNAPRDKSHSKFYPRPRHQTQGLIPLWYGWWYGWWVGFQAGGMHPVLSLKIRIVWINKTTRRWARSCKWLFLLHRHIENDFYHKWALCNNYFKRGNGQHEQK